MNTPQRVQVFGLGVPAKGTPTARRRYRVKWRIDGRDRTRSLKTRAEADRFRRLLDAVEAGEHFDEATGEPASWSSQSLTWFAWSREWLALKWPQWAGTTRRSGVETLVAVAPLMVRPNAPSPPDDLGDWLRREGYLPDMDVSRPVRLADRCGRYGRHAAGRSPGPPRHPATATFSRSKRRRR